MTIRLLWLKERAVSQTSREGCLIHSIYGAAADPGQWPTVLTQVSDWIGATGGLLAYHHKRGEGDFLIPGRLDPELAVRYLQDYHSNPWSSALSTLPPNRMVQMRELVPHSEIIRSEFFHEILKPQQLVNGINWVEPSLSGDGAGGFGFQLNEIQSRDADRAKSRLKRLTSHLSRALNLLVQLASSDAAVTSLEAVIEVLPQAGFLLDAKSRVLFANAQARKELRDTHPFCLSFDGQKRLTARDQSYATALESVIAHAANIASDEQSYRAAPSPIRMQTVQSLDLLAFCAIALPPTAFSHWQMQTSARVLLLAYRPSRPGSGDEAVLQQLFGLTRAESQVAVRVGAGLSREDSALQLRVTAETIKTHVRRCFAKMSVRSSSQLASVVSGLSALPR